ncbi:matrix metalloproteinase-2-like [Cylas formicarius]|uniref:matrix metalloproteinase-2-like n=1 Tax=Cylas formicarius TaxID=197179 RepID=UPI002958ABA6|nr:matrix metalloproteinase-2-like [Cylas formicarius]
MGTKMRDKWARCVVFGWCFLGVTCFPAGKENPSPRQISSDSVLQFMKKYGYIVDDGGQSEALYTEESISNVIKTVQRYGAIKESGIIDNDTLKLMASPRCGVPDVIKSNRQKRFATMDGWNKRNITYYIANWTPRLTESAIAKNIQKALDIWGQYGRLTFSKSFHQDADIIVAFGRGYHGDRYPFDGPGNVLAHAFFPYDREGTGLGGDIHFDDDESWTDRDQADSDRGTDFFTVALHELGHSLGLAHSTVATSIMFPYYRGYDPSAQYQLDYDDILAMYNLYIQRRLKEDDDRILHNTDTSSTTNVITSTRPPITHEPKLPTKPRRKFHHHHPRRGGTSISTKNPWTSESTHTAFPTDYPETTVSYEGDFESVDDHKSHDGKHHVPSTNSPSLPHVCDGHFDAVATLRNELFVFKDQYVWRFKDMGQLVDGYPVPLRQMFPKLPKSVRKIDAVYQRPSGDIILFVGKDVWIYDGTRFVDSPQTLSYFGLPDYLDGIDAVQTWARNGKTYFYKKERFWRYNETSQTMDSGYPLHINRWRGVPENLDAATTWKDEKTYFFKGDLFWKFDNEWITITENSPLPIAPLWVGCREDAEKMRQLFG